MDGRLSMSEHNEEAASDSYLSLRFGMARFSCRLRCELTCLCAPAAAQSRPVDSSCRAPTGLGLRRSYPVNIDKVDEPGSVSLLNFIEDKFVLILSIFCIVVISLETLACALIDHDLHARDLKKVLKLQQLQELPAMVMASVHAAHAKAAALAASNVPNEPQAMVARVETSCSCSPVRRYGND